ncbi:MAG: hypothetical protein U1F57_09030 [bacterium]
MFPLFCYKKEASWRERLALCIETATGRSGAGVLAVSLSYGISGTPDYGRHDVACAQPCLNRSLYRLGQSAAHETCQGAPMNIPFFIIAGLILLVIGAELAAQGPAWRFSSEFPRWSSA